MKTKTTEPDLVEEVDELLASWRPSEIVKQPEQVRDLLRRLKDEVKRLRGVSTDAVIQKIQIMQEKHPGQRIELSVEPDGYCYVTRSDRNGNIQPIAEGATMGDVFED